MFQNSILTIFIASLLVVCKLFNVPSDGFDQDCKYTPLTDDKQSLSLSTHLITSMRITMGKVKGPVCRNKLVLLYLCSLLLAESYAPEPNPGPRRTKFPCGECNKACKWSTPCVCCDSCDTWYHQECMGMADAVFKALTNVSWECTQCGLPNFSTCIFDTTILETSNTFSSLSDTTHTDSEISFSHPNATSSPHRRQASQSESMPGRRYDLPTRILTVNCQSIKSSGKKAALQNMIASTQADIIIGTESWLDSSIKSSEVFPPDFKVYRKDRQYGTRGGGVFILVSDRIPSDEPEELKLDNECEVVWCKVKHQGTQDAYVGAFYRPPSKTDPDYIEQLNTCLSRIPRGAHLWLGGDFNLPDIDWERECPHPQASNMALCQQLLTCTRDAFLDQIVCSPTRITEFSSTMLDLFFTNNKTLVTKCEVIPGIGDHEAVFLESSLRPMRVKKPARKVYQYRKTNYDDMREELDDFWECFENDTRESSANEAWSLFETKLKSLMDKHIPTKMISGTKVSKPWVTRPVRAKHRKVKKLYARQKRTGKATDRKTYLSAKSTAQRMERQEYWKYVEDLIEDGDPESDQVYTKQKRFWSYIKSLRRDSCGIAPLKDGGKLHSDPLDKANILNNQYQSVFTQEDTSNLPTPSGEPSPSMPEITATTEGVLSLLRKLNPQKATGPDMLPARVLKELAENCAPYLQRIYQRCLLSGDIPDIWRTANVSAIFKKGDRFRASNYRPVSLTCICCKLMEHIVVSNIMRHLDQHHILTDCQHGFRRRRSCETQLLTLVDELTKALDKGKQYDIAVLDFSKAFDRVPHKRLLLKLQHYGIRGNTLRWIESFLTGRTQRVTVEGAISEPADVASGVPQGSVLGPVLFLIFINDLPETVQSNTRLFADDCVIYREIRSTADSDTLQKDLKSLWEWEQKWGMSFHPEKCSILRVHRKRSPIIYAYSLKGHTLASDTQTKYLGVEISSDMSWGHHIDKVVKKGNSTLGFLRRNLRIRSEDTKSTAYFTLVRPSLEYCAAVWNPYQKDKIHKLEMVQRRAARYTTNRYHNTSSVSSMLEHLQWESLESRRAKTQLTMMYKITNDLVDIPADKYLIPASSRTRAAHSMKFRQPSTSTSYYSNSFFPRTISAWNKLPATVAESPDLVSFKQGMSSLTV